MHKLLRRQIKRFLGALHPVPEALESLLCAVDSTYAQHDADRKLIQRSLTIVSDEMLEQNRKLSRELKEREAAERDLEHSLSILGATLNSTGDGILVVGNDRRVESYNERFVEMWRLPPEIVAQCDDRALLNHVAVQLSEPDEFLRSVERLTGAEEESLDLIEFIDGRAFERYSQPCRLGGSTIGRVWSFRDVTARHRAEQRLTYLANYDELTGLANRNLLMDRLGQGVANAHRHGDTLAVVFIDLDQFKFVNDSLGHGAGDALLKVIAARLLSCVRESDTVSRNSGDEFVLILNELNGDEVVSEGITHRVRSGADHPLIAATLETILASLGQNIVIDGREINMTCSIGLSLYPQDGNDAGTLLRNADAAMYRAKERGRNNYQFYTADLNARTSERLNLQGRLRNALKRGEFSLQYQPKIDLAGRRLAGVEVLLNWNSPEHGMVAPDRFIPILEDCGMIVEVGTWVMARAAADYRRWLAEGRQAPRIAVNVSQLQMEQEDFVDVVRGVIGEGEIGIDLEITESLIMKDIENNIAKLRAIRDMGVHIAIDDFGTGYSSLSYLAKLPVNSLKIDRSFIAYLTGRADELSIVTTIISLAHSLRLKVTAEGVETPAQSALLSKLGCDEIQGYLISRPLAETEFWEWCDRSDFVDPVATPLRRRGAQTHRLLRAPGAARDS